MGLLDQVLGGVLGSSNRGNANSSPLMSILMALLAQRGGTGGSGGLGDLLGGLAGGGLGSGAGMNSGMNSGMGGGLGGGLGGLLDQFTRAGHGDVANSWVGSGLNREIAPHQLEEVLGGGTVDSLSRQTGMGRDDLLSELSHMLPQAVDQLTPQGRLPDHDEMKHW